MRVSQPKVIICKVCGVVHTETQPWMDCPDTLFTELIDQIRHEMENDPRQLQTRIGPSEVGDPCSRALIHKLMRSPGPRRQPGRPDGWRARVGQAIHSQMEGVFSRDYLLGRYDVEGEVTVGDIAGEPITGHSDLFDIPTGTVVDWKTKTKTKLEKTLRDIRMGRGVEPVYRVQQHLYGRGRKLQGHEVKRVMLVFLPRDGDLRDCGYWWEPFDEQIAIDALQRCTDLVILAQAMGVDNALDLFPLCDQEYCDWCAAERPPPKPFDAGKPPDTRTLLASLR